MNTLSTLTIQDFKDEFDKRKAEFVEKIELALNDIKNDKNNTKILKKY